MRAAVRPCVGDRLWEQEVDTLAIRRVVEHRTRQLPRPDRADESLAPLCRWCRLARGVLRRHCCGVAVEVDDGSGGTDPRPLLPARLPLMKRGPRVDFR